MRFLITGAAGFIGSHLADRLSADGHSVIGVDNLETGRKQNYPMPSALNVFDITDRPKFYALANEFPPDVVIHCAASYSDPNLWHRDTDTNVAGTINAINVARHHNARLIYFNTALPAKSSYAISKIAGEQYIDIGGVPHLIFRLANIYGPRNLSGPIPTFYKRLIANQECTVTATERDTVFIDDLVELVVKAIGMDETGKYDVCSGKHHPISEYFSAVANALNIDASAKHVPAPLDDVLGMCLDPYRAERVFGWRAKTPLTVGVHKAVEWYREHGVGETFTHLKIGVGQ